MLTASGTLGANGWYTGPVTITLTASDSGSGVDYTEYTIDGQVFRYAGPVTLSPEGAYTFTYRTKDLAGNWEALHTVSYQIDLAPPSASARVVQLPGEGVVYLSRTDSGSGIDHLEYSINGGATVAYLDTITLPPGNSYAIQLDSSLRN